MKVLFVCLGNICRSPLAEGLFLHHVKTRGLEDRIQADSCGTGNWHAGELADPRMRKTASMRGIELTHRARQLRDSDFEEFDYILVMDHQNKQDVLNRTSDHAHKVRLISDFHQSYNGMIVPDPYFGDQKDFDEVFDMLNSITENLVHFIQHHQ